MSIDSIIDLIRSTFDGFNDTVENAVNIITQSPESNTAMWSVVQGVQDIVLPVAMTLAVLYFFMDFLNKSMMMEFVRWENVIKVLIRLMFCKTMLEHTGELMGLIFKAIADLTTDLALNGNVLINIDYNALKTTFEGQGLDFFARMALYMRLMPISIIMYLVIKIISLIIYGRMIQIYIYTAFAPIPLASIAGEGMGGSAKAFIKDYASVCLQGAVMLLAIGLFGAIAQDVCTNIDSEAGLGSMLMMSLVLVFILAKSGDWTKKIVGR